MLLIQFACRVQPGSDGHHSCEVKQENRLARPIKDIEIYSLSVTYGREKLENTVSFPLNTRDSQIAEDFAPLRGRISLLGITAKYDVLASRCC